MRWVNVPEKTSHMSLNLEFIAEQGCFSVSKQASSGPSCLLVSLASVLFSWDCDACYIGLHLLVSGQKNVTTRECENRDGLTELYLRHVIPLPQRSLPNSRWGRRMERSRGRETPAGHRSDIYTALQASTLVLCLLIVDISHVPFLTHWKDYLIHE